MNIISTDQRLLPPPPRPQAPESVADMFGVTAAIKMVRRRFFIMAAVGAVVGALILAKSMTATPMYQAVALVAINARQERVIDNAESVLGELPRDTAAIETEIEILRSSPELRDQLVTTLDLLNDPEWNWLLREPPKWRTFVSSLLNPMLQPGADQAAPVDPASFDSDPNLRRAIAGGVAGSLSIRRRGLTYVIEIAGRSPNPVTAQRLANTYADLYLASQATAREEAALRATASLAERLDALSADVQRKEEAVQAYREETGLTATEGQSLTEQQIANIQNAVLTAQAELAERQARYRQLRDLQARGGSLETMGDVQGSAAIRSLRDRESEIARRQSELENRYLPNHPSVQAVRSERDDIQRQISVEVERIAVNMGNEVDVARTRLATLQAQLDAITNELQAENVMNIRAQELEREAEAARQVYASYLQRYQEIVNQESMNSTDARLIANAQGPGWQISPNLRIALALAILAGGFCGLIAGVATELLDRSIRSREEVEQKLGYPAIATIPTIGSSAMKQLPKEARNPPGYLVERPMSAFTEALRVLRTVIVHSQLGSTSRVVAIASALPGEGKTTVALSLARVAALSGQRVIVVDCDLRKQSISRFVEPKPEIGLLQALSGETTWRDVLRRDTRSSADILPVAASPFSSIDVFGSDAMELLLSELRQNYEIVVLDCPPLFAVAEARVICALADSVVLVARMGKSTIDAVRLAVEQIVAAGGKVAGVALNRVPSGGLGRLAYGDSMYSYELRTYYNSR